jgi:hypothetical protein
MMFPGQLSQLDIQALLSDIMGFREFGKFLSSLSPRCSWHVLLVHEDERWQSYQHKRELIDIVNAKDLL